jgi:hypothetical protein
MMMMLATVRRDLGTSGIKSQHRCPYTLESIVGGCMLRWCPKVDSQSAPKPGRVSYQSNWGNAMFITSFKSLCSDCINFQVYVCQTNHDLLIHVWTYHSDSDSNLFRLLDGVGLHPSSLNLIPKFRELGFFFGSSQ